MGVSQIIMIVLLGVSIIINAIQYGNDQNVEEYIKSIISVVILIVLLVSGGYFD